MESLPPTSTTPCDTSTAILKNGYNGGHNPFIRYSDVVSPLSVCESHVFSSQAFNASLEDGTLGNYSLYIPNDYDNGHTTLQGGQGTLANADAWLKGFLGPILNGTENFSGTGNYGSQPTKNEVAHTAFFILYDEGKSASRTGYVSGPPLRACEGISQPPDASVCGGQTYMSVVSPDSLGTKWTQDTTDYNVESTIEWLFDLGSDGGNDGTVYFPPMTSLFSFQSNGYGPGSKVTFKEAGLPSGVTWYVNVSGENPLSNTTTSSGGNTLTTTLGNGAFPFTVTSNNKGWAASYTSPVTVSSSPVSVTVTFTTPAITVTPGEGPVGASVTVAGTGFSDSTTLSSLIFDGVAISTCKSGSLTTTGTGTFSCTFAVPGGTLGTSVVATNAGGQTATGKFTVTPALIAPTISANPTTIDSGQRSTLSTTTSFSGGTSPYTCQWLVEAPGGSYANLGSSFSCTAGSKPTVSTGALSTTGTWSFALHVTDSSSPAEVVYSNAVTVTVNSALSVSVAPTAPTIDSGQTVTLTATGSGGSGGYSYAWYLSTCSGSSLSTTNPYTTPSLTSTTTYCVEVTDSLVSTATALVTVTVNSALGVSVAPTAPTIDSGQTVTLTATGSGGSGGYSYAWYLSTCSGSSLSTINPYTTPSLTSTTTYCVKVTDSLVSAATASVTVTVNSALSVSVAPTAPTIDSGQTVTLTATGSGGSGGYSYAWYLSTCSGSSLSTTNPYTTPSLTSTTTYCVKVTDSLVSTATALVTVTVNSALGVSVAPTAPTIDSGQTVTLTATGSGGSGGYSYAWYLSTCSGSSLSTINPYTTPSLTSTTTYCVKVTDSLVSTATALVTVTVNSALGVSVAPTAPTIDSGQTVTLTATGSGGSGGYSYAWYLSTCSGSSLSTTNPYTTPSLTSTTTYCVEVTDSLVSTATALVTVTVNSALGVSVAPTAPTIDSGQTVTLTATGSGGSGGYSYAWYLSTCSGSSLSTINPYTTPSLTSTTTYCVKVTDSLVSAATASVTVTVNSALSVSVAPTAPTIDSGQTVTLTATGSGGSGGYSYAWYLSTCSGSSLSTTNPYTTPSLTSTTTYCVKVTDSLVSTATALVTVTVNSALGVSVAPTAPTIDSGQTVTLTATGSGGSGGYSYAWYLSTCSGSSLSTINPYTTPSLTSTTTYCVEVTDSLVSTATALVTVTVNSALGVSVAPTAPTIDSGQTVTLTATGSGGSGGYSYAWYLSTCSGSSLSTINPYTTPSLTSTTTYCVKVTDSLVSTATALVTVTVNSALGVSVAPTAPTIDSGQTVTLTATGSGGSGGYSYAWYLSTCSGSSLSTINPYTTPSLTSTTTYCVKVTDSLVSTATALVTVTVNSALGVSVAPTAPTIDSGQTVTLTATGSGGSGGYSYAWYLSTCSGSSLSTINPYTTPSLTSTTTYCVKVTDSLVSTATALVTVTVNSALGVSVAPTAPTIDSGQTVTLTATGSGGSGGYSYAWYLSTCSGSSLSTINPYTTPSLTSTTTYCVEVTDSLVSTATALVTVTVNSALSVSVAPTAPTIDSGQTVTLTATGSGGSGGYSYQWYESDCSTVASGTSNAAAYTTPTLTSTTAYCVEVTDSLGSTATASVTVTVTVTTPGISVSPGQAPVGATVRVSGTGFSVLSTVGLVFDGVAITAARVGPP